MPCHFLSSSSSSFLFLFLFLLFIYLFHSHEEKKIANQKKKKKKFLVNVIICEWSCKIIGKGLEELFKLKKKNPEKRKKQSNVEEMTWQKDP